MPTLEAISARQMRAIEMNAEYLGISRLQLMENAGAAVARCIAAAGKGRRVVVCAGLGGNGGDGFVAARHLVAGNFDVHVVLAGKPELIADADAKRNWEAIERLDSVSKHTAYDSSVVPDLEADIVIDALLGIGAKGAPKEPIRTLVSKINESVAYKVAIDVPTGVDADTGEAPAEAVKADLTVTFHKPKKGLLKAEEFVGKLAVVDIGIPPEAELYAGPGDVLLAKAWRPPEAHKGQFGRLLIVGGSEIFTGAPAMVALSALRTGADLAYVVAPYETALAVASMSPNLIAIRLEGKHLAEPNVSTIAGLLDRATAVVVGPGLGLHRDTIEAANMVIGVVDGARLPLLIDADGLKALAQAKRKFRTRVVLTPHAGEYKLLFGEAPPKDLKERAEHVLKRAKAMRACILLKGHVDVISDGTRVKLNRTGNPGMTVGGTGDTLSGIIGALLAQGFDPFEAAVAGAFVNGAAGDFVYREKGYHILPTDIINYIPKVMEDPMSHVEVRLW